MMDALIEDNIMFSNSENNAPVFAHSEEVPQLSVEQMIEKGSKILTRCLNILRNLENLRADAAFDEVCKILFIKILEDRKEIRVLNYWDIDTEDITQAIFNEAKKSNDCNVFDKTDTINIKVKTFNHVLSELMHLDWANEISDDARGQLFDNLLNGLSRNSMGEMFTPPTIVDYMIDILNPQASEMICDPFCGNGSFLIKSYQYTKSESARRIYGVDINETAIKNAKVKAFMHNIKGINFFSQDSLLDSNEINENRFDIIFAQPPFGFRSYDSHDVFHGKYKIYQTHKQLDFIFIQRCLNLLRDGGRMGIIVSENVLFNEKFKEARHFIELQAKIFKIVSLPANTFYPFTAIKTSIIFLQKLNQKDIKSPLDYNVLFADINEVGISLRANKVVSNELILLAKEYKTNLINNEIGNQTLLKVTDYAQFEKLNNWSVSYLKNTDIAIAGKYNHFKLSTLLVKNTESIYIEDSQEYNRVTVKLYNNGVVLRDTIIGEDIGTKRQFRISKGQLIISKIGIFDGAIGIVPNELDNAIVTSDFSTYTVKIDVVLPEYLELLLSSDKFRAYFTELGRGSVIRRLHEKLFLNIDIPVPTLAEQNELCQRIVQLKRNIKQLEQDLINEKNLFKNTLFDN
jgi:type I restriction enzyme M protein